MNGSYGGIRMVLYVLRDGGPLGRHSDFHFVALRSFLHVLPTQCSTSDMFTVLNVNYTSMLQHVALGNDDPNSTASSAIANDFKTLKLGTSQCQRCERTSAQERQELRRMKPQQLHIKVPVIIPANYPGETPPHFLTSNTNSSSYFKPI